MHVVEANGAEVAVLLLIHSHRHLGELLIEMD